MSDSIDYDELRQKVEAGVKQQKKIARFVFFGVNLFIFGVFMIISFFIAQSNPEIQNALNNTDLPALLMLPYMGWIMAIVFQGISLLMESGLTDKQLRGQIIARELGEQMLKMGSMQEKTKRHLEGQDMADEIAEEMVLGEDGELKYVHEQDSASQQQSARR